MYKSKACTQRGGMHRRIHSEPSLMPAWTHPTCVLAKCGSPESDIPCRASSATRSHLRRGAWRQPASLGDRTCPGQHVSRRPEEVPECPKYRSDHHEPQSGARALASASRYEPALMVDYFLFL